MKYCEQKPSLKEVHGNWNLLNRSLARKEKRMVAWTTHKNDPSLSRSPISLLLKKKEKDFPYVSIL